ncbi:MAG: TonB family protein [Sphingomonas sp.]
MVMVMVMFRLAVAAVAVLSAVVLPMASARAAENKEAKVEPIGNPASWFSSDDYPPEARRNNQAGRVSIALSVDPAGKVVGCDVISSSGFPLLDTGTCEVALRNGRFTPARAASGKAVVGTFVIPGVRWQLAEPDPMDLSAGRKVLFRSVVESRIDPSGIVTSCKVVESDGNPNDPCAGQVGVRITQPLIKGGKPVSGTLTFTATGAIVPD